MIGGSWCGRLRRRDEVGDSRVIANVNVGGPAKRIKGPRRSASSMLSIRKPHRRPHARTSPTLHGAPHCDIWIPCSAPCRSIHPLDAEFTIVNVDDGSDHPPSAECSGTVGDLTARDVKPWGLAVKRAKPMKGTEDAHRRTLRFPAVRVLSIASNTEYPALTMRKPRVGCQPTLKCSLDFSPEVFGNRCCCSRSNVSTVGVTSPCVDVQS
jgi:hypothetical protein